MCGGGNGLPQPVTSAPLPKEGWYGEAVTRGFRPPPHPRQGTRALPYKALRYRARADRVVRPYKYLSVSTS